MAIDKVKKEVLDANLSGKLVIEFVNKPNDQKFPLEGIKDSEALEAFEIGGANAEDENLIVYDGLNANDNN